MLTKAFIATFLMKKNNIVLCMNWRNKLHLSGRMFISLPMYGHCVYVKFIGLMLYNIQLWELVWERAWKSERKRER